MLSILCAKLRYAGESRSGSWASEKAWTAALPSRIALVRISPFRVYHWILRGDGNTLVEVN